MGSHPVLARVHPSAARPDRSAAAGDPDEAAATCPYCGRPFARERYRTLHVGLDHPGRLTEEERTAFRRAYREETAEIRRFRLKILALLVVLYFGVLFTYMVVT